MTGADDDATVREVVGKLWGDDGEVVWRPWGRDGETAGNLACHDCGDNFLLQSCLFVCCISLNISQVTEIIHSLRVSILVTRCNLTVMFRISVTRRLSNHVTCPALERSRTMTEELPL